MDEVVMITGASGNLGSAFAKAFHTQNCRLALIDRHPERVAEMFPDLPPDRLLTVNADLTSHTAVQEIVQLVIAHFGRIDVLINTVGGFQSGTPLHEMEKERFDFMMTLNVSTVFNTTQAVLPQMIEQGGGKIINIGARPGLQGKAGMAAYSASKAAMIRLTESTAADVKALGINVNCILPSTLDTPQNRKAMPNADPSKWVTPESLANVVSFLASPAAKDIHGASIPVYGLS